MTKLIKVFSQIACVSLAGIVLAIAGCQPESDPFLDLVDSQSGTQSINDLQRTMSLAVSDSSYDYRQYEEKISGGLNRWMRTVLELGGESADDSSQWKPDSAVLPLIEKYADVPAVSQFDQLEFVSTDPYFIRERSWMKQIASRVCSAQPLNAMELTRLQAGNFRPSSDSTTPVYDLVQQLHPGLKPGDTEKLADAWMLFDWITRNIQLEEMPEIGDDEAEEFRLQEGEGLSRPGMGVPGPGYRRFIWQILVYARADALEKAKLFHGLCRQRGIDTVMLNVDGKPWAMAALIGDQAWLFDLSLGLPVPGEKPGQVATLADARSTPALLSGLNLTVAETNRDDSKYHVQPNQLDSLSATVLVTPESVSRRMTFLQNRLLGDQRLELVDFPSAVSKRFSAIVPDVEVTLSPVAFQTHLFRRVVGEALRRASFDSVIATRLGWYYSEEFYIDAFVDYRLARNLFFVGRFETPRNSRKLSAVSGFFSLMYTDDLIANIAFDEARLNRLGIRQESGQSEAEFRQRLTSLQNNMRLVRRDVGVFLAQSHFDNGNISSCGNWLETLQKRDDTSRWNPVMKYLQGRAEESIGNYDQAIADYRAAEGAQWIGNHIRARLLKQAIVDAGLKNALADAEKPDVEKPDAEKPDAEKPDAEKPDAEKPDAEKRDTDQPDGDSPV